MNRPRLTCCIIARDEEQWLPGCLASVDGVVDETIVVDTGSRDRTVELARAAGARVAEHAWDDDFAAARNAALPLVEDGYVLVLDADERLAPNARAVLHEALRRGGFDVGLVPLHHARTLESVASAVLDGSERMGDPVLLPRLLRYTSDLVWQGRVHESVAEWARGRRVEILEAPIVHYGAVPEVRESLGKNARNLTLLERRVAEEPENASVRAYLARELQRAGRSQEALPHAQAGFDALLRAHDAGSRDDFVLPATIYAQLLFDAGRLTELVSVLATVASRGWEHPNFWFLAGALAEQHAFRADDAAAMLEQSAEFYTRCVADAGRTFEGEAIPGARGWQALTRLGTVELRRGKGTAALRAFDEALALRPTELEARLGRAEAMLLVDAPDRALAELEALVAEDQLDAWVLSMLAALALSRRDDASLFAAQVERVAVTGSLLAPHRQSIVDELAAQEASAPATGPGEAAAMGPAPASARPVPRAPETARSVLVLGAGRSGTSMVAGTLAEAGWFPGHDLIPARESNPKGFFEAPEINGINEQLLAAALPSWHRFGSGQRWLAEPDSAVVAAPGRSVEHRIARLTERRPFAYKDPRFCHTLSAWRPHLPEDTGFVCVFRDPATTAESIVRECASEEYLRGVEMDFERALDVWLAHYRAVLAQPRTGADWLFLHYDQVVNGDGLRALEAFVHAPVARSFPEARLSRSQSEEAVPEEVASVYRELCALAGHAASTVAAAAPAELPRVEACATPELSVVLCTFDRLETLRRSVASFEAQREARSAFELVIVDDGSTDGTSAWLDAHEFEVATRVVHQQNRGLAAARNAGIEVARGELLLFVNDDTMAAPDLIARHISAHAAHGGSAAPVCVLGTFEQPDDVLANAFMRLVEQTDYVFCYDGMQAGQLYDWTKFWTCNVSARADAVRQAGGFDESFRHYGCEDTDLGIRLGQLGHRVLFEPLARATHEHVLDLDALEHRSRLVARAWIRLVAKHPHTLEHPNWSWLAPLGQASCERLLVDRLQFTGQWRSAVLELANVDIGRVEAASPDAAARILSVLNAPLRELHSTWWHEGIRDGLADFDVETVAELTARASQRKTVLAWPQYGAGGEVGEMLAAYGRALTEPPVKLVLVHDAALDGSIEDAVQEIERAYAAHLPEGVELDVELVSDPSDEERIASLRHSVDAVVELPGSKKGARRALIDRVAAPSLQAAPPG